jgi:hypothetical protein
MGLNMKVKMRIKKQRMQTHRVCVCALLNLYNYFNDYTCCVGRNGGSAKTYLLKIDIDPYLEDRKVDAYKLPMSEDLQNELYTFKPDVLLGLLSMLTKRVHLLVEEKIIENSGK